MAGVNRWAAAVVAALVGSAGVASATEAQAPARQPAITVTELRGPDGQPMVEAMRINERGQVVGRLAPLGAAALWHEGVATPFSPPSGFLYPFDLSDRGHVAGTAAGLVGSLPFAAADGAWRLLPVDEGTGGAFAVDHWGRVLGYRKACPVGVPWCDEPYETRVWDGEEVITPPALDPAEETRPVDMNDRGQALVTIEAAAGDSVAAVWRVGGGVAELPVPDGAAADGSAINDRGDVAGVITLGDGAHAALWRRGRLVDLGTLGGQNSRVGDHETLLQHQALSDQGHVVGVSATADGDEHAYLWHGGEMVDLGTLGGTMSAATAVNDRGQVVGYSTTATGEVHAFVWDGGRMIDLGRSFGGASSRALDINDRGQIIGEVLTEGPEATERQAVLWTGPWTRPVTPGARPG